MGVVGRAKRMQGSSALGGLDAEMTAKWAEAKSCATLLTHTRTIFWVHYVPVLPRKASVYVDRYRDAIDEMNRG